MTDKQIIIDGVDVSGCENYGETMAKTHNCTLYDEYLRPCKGTDCYYKQLKSKEQECEELKNIINEAKNSKLDLNSFFAIEATVGEYQLELDQLKAENDELKKKCNIYTCGICGNKEDCNKLYKTLTEIKEIIHFNKTNRLSGGAYISIEQILQKISECEGNDELTK